MGYLKVQAVTGLCPVCLGKLGVVPVAELKMATTAPALQMLRGLGHLVVLTGRTWLVRCAQDQHDRLSLASGVGAEPESPSLPASAATQPQGARRGKG